MGNAAEVKAAEGGKSGTGEAGGGRSARAAPGAFGAKSLL